MPFSQFAGTQTTQASIVEKTLELQKRFSAPPLLVALPVAHQRQNYLEDQCPRRPQLGPEPVQPAVVLLRSSAKERHLYQPADAALDCHLQRSLARLAHHYHQLHRRLASSFALPPLKLVASEPWNVELLNFPLPDGHPRLSR